MKSLIIRQLNTLSYAVTWHAMQLMTQRRQADTCDELWLLEHPPVFTQGQAGKDEHILNPHNIPVIRTDRGGQVTYHGPGQLMVYTLLDLKPDKLAPRQLVNKIEQVVLEVLSSINIQGHLIKEAPGIYVDRAKISSIGLRIKRGASYHGIALNVHMDLTPFSYINPCGFKNLKMTQISQFSSTETLETVKTKIISCFINHFSYTNILTRYEIPQELLHEQNTTAV